MSYITKHLESLMTKSDKVQDSQTTSSKYYTIGGILVRVGDHFSTKLKSNKRSPDIDIVNPINASTMYIVQVKEGLNLMYFSLKDLKKFIENYRLIRNISSKQEIAKSNKADREQKLAKVLKTGWNAKSKYLSDNFSKYPLLTKGAKKCMLRTNGNYSGEEMLEKLKALEVQELFLKRGVEFTVFFEENW